MEFVSNAMDSTGVEPRVRSYDHRGILCRGVIPQSGLEITSECFPKYGDGLGEPSDNISWDKCLEPIDPTEIPPFQCHIEEAFKSFLYI